ncbi:MAG: hypothetical protein K0S12_1907 [Bacteroidetes bacterium]|nr:hypothetical protein [Bacteroidota bacterium]
MITKISALPPNMVGFIASGEVSAQDFSETVMPEVQRLIQSTGKLNYLLVLDTSVKNFTAGAWFQDAIMGVKHLTKWNRAAIVTDMENIRRFTDIFSVLMPGEFKGFEHKDLEAAIKWTSEQVK